MLVPPELLLYNITVKSLAKKLFPTINNVDFLLSSFSVVKFLVANTEIASPPASSSSSVFEAVVKLVLFLKNAVLLFEIRVSVATPRLLSSSLDAI